MLADLFTNIAFIVTALFVAGQLLKNRPVGQESASLLRASIGVVFGILGITLMRYAIHPIDNVIVDLRHTAIVASGLLGGPIAAICSSVIIACYRLVIFGVNIASITGLITALIMGAGCAYIAVRASTLLKKAVYMFAFALLISSLGIVYSIKDSLRLNEILAFYWPLSILGAIFTFYCSEYIIASNQGFREMLYYRLMDESLTDMVSTHNSDGTFRYVSYSSENLLGYRYEELTGSYPRNIVHPDDANSFEQALQSAWGYRGNSAATIRFKRKNDCYIWVAVSCKAITDHKGKVEEVLCVSRDITEEKKAYDQLALINLELVTTLESIQDAFFSLDKFWKFTYTNKHAELLLDKRSEELITNCVWDLFPEWINTMIYSECKKATQHQRSTSFEMFYEAINKWLYIRVYPGKDGVSIYCQDITQRKVMESQLNSTSAKFQAVFDNAGTGIVLRNLDGKALEANTRYLEMLGYSRDEIIHIEDLVYPDDLRKEEALARKLMSGSINSYTTERRYIKKDGTLLWAQAAVSIVRNQLASSSYVIIMINDISKRKVAEQQLKNSERKFRSLVGSMDDIVFMLDHQKRFTGVFGRWLESFGQTEEFYIGKTAEELIGIDKARIHNNAYDQALQGKRIVYNWQNKERHYQTALSPIFDDEDKVIGLVGVGRDTTHEIYLTYYDVLTGLNNRRYFEMKLQEYEASSDGAVGVSVIDVDALKFINDTLGHQVGDDIIKAAGMVLKNSASDADVVARIGGDEFVIIKVNPAENWLQYLKESICSNIKQYNMADGRIVPLHMSQGVAAGTGRVIRNVFSQADDDMYNVKNETKLLKREAMTEHLLTLAETLELNDNNHSARVRSMAATMGLVLGLSAQTLRNFILGAQYHDVGKVGRLFSGIRSYTKDEDRKHCEIGYRIAQASQKLAPAADIIYHHHEWWNGSGFPGGLSGEQIPLEARIIAVIDVYDNLITGNGIEPAQDWQTALGEVKRLACSRLDPFVVETFEKVIINLYQDSGTVTEHEGNG